MTQTNTLWRERIVHIGEESTFGTALTDTAPAGSFPNRFAPIVTLADELVFDAIVREMLENNDERTRRLDAIDRIPGLTLGSKAALSVQLKAIPTANILSATGAVGSLSHRLLLRHHFGAERAAVGTTVNDPAASETVFIVTSATNMLKGTIIAVEHNTDTYEVALITNVVGTTVTVTPGLSTAPSTGAKVRNLYNYAPANVHTGSGTGANTGGSLSIRGAFVRDTAAEYTLTGCYGNLAFAFPEFGKVPTLKFGCDVVGVTGPSNALSLTAPTDDMGAPVIFSPTVYFAEPTIARATRYVCESLEIDHVNVWEQVREGGATQTVLDVVNTAGRPIAAKFKMKVRFDQVEDATYFAVRTARPLWIINSYGSGATQEFQVWQIPRALLSAKPKLSKVGNRLYMELEGEGLQDTSVDTPGTPVADEDFHRAPIRFAMG